MTRSGLCCALACAAALAAVEAVAEESGDAPTLVEMFVSQSCSASPPAAAYLGELSTRRDIVALAWHVDYWNKIPARNVGAWSDPFSRAAFTERQRAYNERIRGRRVVFTPQAVINGALSLPGANRLDIERALLSRRHDENADDGLPELEVERVDGRGDAPLRYRAEVEGAKNSFEILVVDFRPAVSTEVRGGDNAGSILKGVNVVARVRSPDTVVRGGRVYEFSEPAPGLGCAVVVQEPRQGKVIAAQYCPKPKK